MNPPDQNAPDQSVGVARQQSPIYSIAELQHEFRQGEIVTGLIQHIYRPRSESVQLIEHRFVIILSQDCDLLREFSDRAKPQLERPLNGILLFEMGPVPEMRQKMNADSKLWKPVRENKNERYHFLEGVPPDLDLCHEGVPDLLIDFRRYFTMPSDEISDQCTTGPAKRRSRLEMPYREHLQCRAVFYMQRVMLPLDHGKGGITVEAQKALPPA